MLRKLMYVVVRALTAVLLAIVIILLPPVERLPVWLAHAEVGIVVFLLVCYIGKLLYDTLFYDRYTLK